MNMHMTVEVNGKKEEREVDKMTKHPDTGMYVSIPKLRKDETINFSVTGDILVFSTGT